MKKNVFKIFICMLLAISMLSACTGKSVPSATSSPTQKPAVSSPSATSPAQTQEPVSADYFPLKQKITVTMAGHRADANTPFAEVEYFKELEQRTNIQINWIDWPAIALKEKKSLAFASGDLPDAIYGSWVLSTTDVVNYGGQGFLLSFNDYINDEYMPNFMSVKETLPGLEKSIATPDGAIYALPTTYRIGLTDTHAALLINTDWLSQVGKNIPTTTDEFFDVLMAFKSAGDLNKNGKNDEIPFTFRYLENNASILEFIGFTGMTGSQLGQRMVLKNDKLVFYPAEAEYKEALIYLNKLYANGLIDQEVFTIDSAAYNAKTQAAVPVGGVISAWAAETLNNPMGNNDVSKDGTYVYLAPLKNSNNPSVEPVWYKRNNPLNSNLCFVINAKTKYAEELVRWADIAYDIEESIKIFYGPDGSFVKKIGDNLYENVRKPDGSLFSHADRSVLVPGNYGLCSILVDDFAIATTPNVQNKASANIFYAPYLDKLYDYSGMPTGEEATLMSDIATSLTDYVDQFTAKSITEGNVEQNWDTYINGLKALRVDDYIKVKTDIYNRIK